MTACFHDTGTEEAEPAEKGPRARVEDNRETKGSEMSSIQILIAGVIIFVVAVFIANRSREKRRSDLVAAARTPSTEVVARARERELKLAKTPLAPRGMPGRQPRSTSAPRLEKLQDSNALRQNLRLKVTYDEAKIERLIEFERSELKRKGDHPETVENLMERAIARWERENRG